MAPEPPLRGNGSNVPSCSDPPREAERRGRARRATGRPSTDERAYAVIAELCCKLRRGWLH
eukprot:12244231-Alexandrium_andersonii.AAC.1